MPNKRSFNWSTTMRRTLFCSLFFLMLSCAMQAQSVCEESSLRNINEARSTDATRLEIVDIHRHSAAARYTLTIIVPETGPTTLKLYNALGDELRIFLHGESIEAGPHTLVIDVDYLPVGEYQ